MVKRQNFVYSKILEKVFRDFIKNEIVKTNRIVIPLIVGIIIIIGAIIVLDQGPNTIMEDKNSNKKTETVNEENDEVQKKLDEIKKDKTENEYSPKPREWITSGPFQIDRSEYVLGEKIFLRASELKNNELGEIIFHRPAKGIDDSIYLTIPFNGEKQSEFNYYLDPQLTKNRGFCTMDDFVGEWVVVFKGTNYESLKFKITEGILPGEEEDYQPVC